MTKTKQDYSKYRKERIAKGLCPCSRKRDDLTKVLCKACRDYRKNKTKSIRQRTLEGAVCKCCGEATPEFLGIIYSELQVLCFNCKEVKLRGKICPHELKRQEAMVGI